VPVFFFDTDDGQTTFRDDVGTELPDQEAARDEASHALAELAKEYLPGGAPQKNITMWVRDQNGEAVMQLALSFAVKALT